MTLSEVTNIESSKKGLTVCVFCGSKPGSTPKFMELANKLAHVFASQNISLVYGGGTVGLMGELAKTLVSLSGPSAVHGVIPDALIRKERNGETPDESTYGRTTVVKDMHTRKRTMAQEADAFVAMPGGYGTMEELFEMITWNQLGIHDKPIVVLNMEGFYDGIMSWVDKSIETGFVTEENRTILAEAKTPDEVLDKIKDYKLSAGRFNLTWGKE